jgi:hypothetical protein
MNRWLARVAAGIGAGVDVAYLVVIGDQGGGFPARVAFVATFIAAMVVFSVAAAGIAPRDATLGQTLLVAAGTGLLAMGAVALASIGIGLIVAGLLAFAAAGRRRLPWLATGAISIVVVAALLAGLALT